MKRILVVRYDTIGDSIFASAFLRELRFNLPDAQIDVLADAPAKSLLVDCPYVDNFINIFHKRYKYLDTFKYLPVFKQYDTVFFLKHARTFSILMKLAGVENRIGFGVRRNKFLTLKVLYNEDRQEVDCYLDLLKAVGLKVTNENTELWINPQSEIKIKDLIEESSCNKNLRVVIQAYSRIKEKNWLDKYWIEIIKRNYPISHTYLKLMLI